MSLIVVTDVKDGGEDEDVKVRKKEGKRSGRCVGTPGIIMQFFNSFTT